MFPYLCQYQVYKFYDILSYTYIFSLFYIFVSLSLNPLFLVTDSIFYVTYPNCFLTYDVFCYNHSNFYIVIFEKCYFGHPYSTVYMFRFFLFVFKNFSVFLVCYFVFLISLPFFTYLVVTRVEVGQVTYTLTPETSSTSLSFIKTYLLLTSIRFKLLLSV